MADNATLISIMVKGIMNNVENSANMLTININQIINEYGKEQDRDSSITDLKYYADITNELSYSQLVFPEVDSLAFIDLDGTIYGSSPKLEAAQFPVLEAPMLESLNNTSGTNVFFSMENRNYLTEDQDDIILSLGKKVYDIRTGDPLGYLILNLNEITLSDVYRQIGFIENEEYLIVNSQGAVISAVDPDKRLRLLSDERLRNRILSREDMIDRVESDQGSYLLSSEYVQQYGWRLVHYIPLDALTSEVNQMRTLIFVSGLLCLLITLLAAGVLSDVIAKPIISLSSSMKRFREGHLDMELEVHSRDEIGLLANGFNKMIQRIKALLDRIKTEQQQKRQIEYALIQAQIKPHFLYNTLDVIYALSEMNRTKDLQKTTKALADFYRSVLSKGRELITIEDEIKNVQDYLSIQQLRYADVFKYTIHIDSSIQLVHIPKLSLQPLVENAIYHGLKEQDEFGTLLIKGFVQGDRCCIEISDDGVGLSSERLQQIREELNEERADSIYGLYNVHRRLQLFYGEGSGLEINSGLGQGTIVTVQIPLVQDRVDAE